MARTEKRLAGPAQIATGPATIYTVPASTKTKVRWIHINNPSGSAVTVTLSVGADAVATRLLDAFSIPAKAAGVMNSYLDIYPDLTLTAAEVVQAAAGTNNILVIVLNGYEDAL